MRSVVSAENPGISFGEVGKQLGARWAEVDEKTKKARARGPGSGPASRGGSYKGAGPARVRRGGLGKRKSVATTPCRRLQNEPCGRIRAGIRAPSGTLPRYAWPGRSQLACGPDAVADEAPGRVAFLNCCPFLPVDPLRADAPPRARRSTRTCTSRTRSATSASRLRACPQPPPHSGLLDSEKSWLAMLTLTPTHAPLVCSYEASKK
jgi:hypothetical protein